MRILIVGNGGREHAILWRLTKDHPEGIFFITKGNGGTDELATPVVVGPGEVEKLALFALQEEIELTVVGPEAPLAKGIVDHFRERELRIFGPTWRGAKIETSKAYAKHLMRQYGIPTARFEDFDDPGRAREYIEHVGAPIVVKADGLAGGKGSFVCHTTEEALEAVEILMVERRFGEAGKEVVVEECLEGEEVSFIAFCDGKELVPLIPTQDHKPIGEGDQGPNTGGMGAYGPVSIVDEALADEITAQILRPTVRAMAEEGRPYQGVLYAALMMTEEGPKVLEFNARFGDPETQAILPLMDGNLLDLMQRTIDGTLDAAEVGWRDGAAICVVLASGGYPGEYETGKPITLPSALSEDVMVFHAGTRREEGRVVTSGGRVLGVTGIGSDLPEAVESAYKVAEQIEYEGRYYRQDIGFRELERLGTKAE